MAPAAPAQAPPARSRRGFELPRHVYPLRTLGLAAGFVSVAVVFGEVGVHPLAWAALVFHGFAWPHLAYLVARRNADPWSAERRNLVIDSAVGGVWVSLMGFNLLPSVLLVSMMSLDKISVGGPRLLTATWVAMLAGGALTTLAFAPAVRVESSFAVIVASIPLLVLYPLSVGITTYRLRQRVREQNRRLDHLLRTEQLSGLATRQHWEEAVVREFERCRRTGRTAGLIFIDLDDFKAINDRFGHLVGDEVIRRIGDILRKSLRPSDVACRYGGDEFGVLVPDSGAAGAAAAGARVRAALERLRLPANPELRCTASLGVAEIGPGTASTLEAIGQADRALYRAKEAGRNRVHLHEP
ncbi:MAG TPA: diguanylate cyclase [Usitatibacteraceae bacterium]|nr:diguanylate cyclase [Usitatibacteraceae bacterium]